MPRDSEAAPPEELLHALTSALRVLGSNADEMAALRESFEHAVRGFGAEKGLLLYVKETDPLTLENVHATGLSSEQIQACVQGRSVEGVSPSIVRHAIREREPQLIENSLVARPTATGSLAGAPYSVLCAPVMDPWTGSPLAVLYFQTFGATRSYRASDLAFVTSYATALGHAFGLFLSSVRRYRELEEDWRRLQSERADAPEIIGDSEAMGRLRAQLHKTYIPATVASDPEPLLIVGPTGSGKELIAQYIHYYSPTRRNHPFLAFNCATLRASDLGHAILFGHTKGAFTGATESKPGLFRSAHKGTLLLDEVGELPLDAQSLLFRAISSRRVLPLGATEEAPFDIQLVLATNRDLAAAVREGAFREELYQRIKALTIRLSALSARPGDVRPLLTHFLAYHETRMRKRTRGLTPEALRLLLSYAWPGNVRELAGVCAALVTHAESQSFIDARDVAEHCTDVVNGPRNPSAHLIDESLAGSFQEARDLFERRFLLARLEAHQWNVAEAARSLGISTATLYRYLQRHGLRQAPEES